ncbi:MAG: cysteine desulfurase family protein [Candidatus Bipolaricaulia bacterium]
MNKTIYLDNSATTPVAESVVEAMLPYFATTYGNASSLHDAGRAARLALEESRAEIAERLAVLPEEIFFTSGATEANNLALMGSALAARERGHIIASSVEHHAVLHTMQWLESRGLDATILDVDSTGRLDPSRVRDAIREDTLIVSVMAGNNEIGTLQPIGEIGRICRERGVLFHTDAVQAYGKVPIPMETIDLLAISAHKFHGPKGVGFLFSRKGTRLTPIVHGGGHERGLRSGTENVPGIVGLAAATRLAFDEQEEVTARMRGFREQLIREVLKIPGTRLNGHPTESLPHIANFSFQAIEGESLIMRLDERGISASTGSACSSPNLEASHVLMAIGVPITMAHGSLRISTGRQTTTTEIETLLEILPGVVEDLRAISPFKVGE